MIRNGFEYDDDISPICEYLDQLSASDELNRAPLPSAELIWWRAQLEQKRALAKRSVQAIAVVRAAAIVLSIAFVVAASFFWAPEAFRNLPIPVPLTMTCLALLACSTGGVLAVWARQR